MKPISIAVACYLLSQTAFSKTLELQNDDQTRTQSIVFVANPGDAADANGELIGRDGAAIPLQKTGDGRCCFILPSIAAGEKLSLRYQPAAQPPKLNALAKEANDQVQFSIGERTVVSYQASAKKAPREKLDPKFLRGGYLHPVMTPSGKIVTDDYAENHLHHHGIWMAWTKAKYQGRETDFWNMGQGKGKVDFVSLEKSWSGPVQAGLISHQKYTDLTSGKPIDVLNEKWTIRVYAAGDLYNIIDLDTEQTVIGDEPLELPIYHYGGLGVRGLGEWNGKDSAAFLTSESVSDRIKANGQPARWARMSGKVSSGTASISVLSHPDNFRAPQPVRIHPTEPFVCFAPQTNEAMSIQPKETYRVKYRFIISDGEADARLLDHLWQEYAKPLVATWKD